MADASTVEHELAALTAFVHRHPRLLVLTGAGCSTESGIPDYRDTNGQWKRPAPMDYKTFTGDDVARRRYWARSLIGWPAMDKAQPGPSHHALARLEAAGHVALLLTQNVDGLHRAAGSRRIIDLHGCLDTVRCLACDSRLPRTRLQAMLLELNPSWDGHDAAMAPDGDADLDGLDFSSFQVPECPACKHGMLKPDVVFFGESVPRQRVDAAMTALQQADALLVIGSSLMVYSGFRFARAAAAGNKPIAAINLGRTRADELMTIKVEQTAGRSLPVLVDMLAATPPPSLSSPSQTGNAAEKHA